MGHYRVLRGGEHLVRSNPKLLWLPSSAKIKGCQGIPKGLERSLALLMVYIVFLAVMDNTTGQSTCYENGTLCRANRSGNLPRLCFSPTSTAISCIVFGCLWYLCFRWEGKTMCTESAQDHSTTINRARKKSQFTDQIVAGHVQSPPQSSFPKGKGTGPKPHPICLSHFTGVIGFTRSRPSPRRI